MFIARMAGILMRACCPTKRYQGYVRLKMLPIQLTAWYLFPCRHIHTRFFISFSAYWHEHNSQEINAFSSFDPFIQFCLSLFSAFVRCLNRFLSWLNNYPVYYIAATKCEEKERKKRKRERKNRHTQHHPIQSNPFNVPAKCQNHRNSRQSSLHLTFSCSLLCCRWIEGLASYSWRT